MAPLNPSTEVEPNFAGESWEAARDGIISGGKTAEEAIEILTQSWRAQHERNLVAWNEHLQQQQQAPGPNGGNGGNPPITPPGNAADEAPEWLNEPTPSFLDIQPARHILKRLEKKEYIELWHFTAQGCRDAAIADLTTPDDTFGIVNTEKGFLFQSVGASTISSKIVKDENLSWEQMSEGKGRLLGCMLANGWGEYEMRELAKFFLNLDLHPIRAQSYGTQAVLRYQDRVRRNWVGRCRNGKPFAIGTINDTLLSNYQSQIGMEIQAKNNMLQSELLRKQEETFNRNSQRFPTQNRDSGPRKARSSRSRSPVRHTSNYRQRSRSPEGGKRSSFRPSTSGSDD